MEDEDNGFEDGSQGENAGNPAWSPFLEAIPEDLHEKVTPVLKEWDSNFQGQVQKVHSEYEPYKFLKEDGVSGDDVRMAIGIMNAIQDDPEGVYKSLGENFGFNTAANNAGTQNAGNTGQGGSGQGNQDNAAAIAAQLPPEIRAELDRLNKGHETMAQIILREQEKQQEADRDTALQNELQQLKEKHGDFNDRFVLGHMATGTSGEEAVKAYQEMVQQIRTEDRRPKPPKLLSSGNAGIPGTGKVDVTKLDGKATKELVIQYLRDSKAANQD